MRGTADDQVLTLLAIPDGEVGPSTTVFQNTGAIGRYDTFEASLTKRFSSRWSAGMGYNYTWLQEHQNQLASNTISSSLGDFPNTPNDSLVTPDNGLHDYSQWGFRAYGTVDVPLGIRLSPVFRHQSGNAYGRYIGGVNAPSAIGFFSGTVLVEPIGTFRTDNINLFDVRAEKIFTLGPTTRLHGFLDLFNLTNSNAVETLSYSTGSGFQGPTNIVAPRALRLGAASSGNGMGIWSRPPWRLHMSWLLWGSHLRGRFPRRPPAPFSAPLLRVRSKRCAVIPSSASRSVPRSVLASGSSWGCGSSPATC